MLATSNVASNGAPPNLCGLYVLSGVGELAVFDETGRPRNDPSLNQALSDYLKNFLKGYLKDPRANRRRLGVFFEKPNKNIPFTVVFEEAVVRDLFPVGGRASGLTTFQQKNRVQPAYHAFALLLDKRNEIVLDAPVYCPVLFNRHVSLSNYEKDFSLVLTESEKSFPAWDVLNLAADASLAQRTADGWRVLKDRLYRGAVTRDLHQDNSFAVVATHENWSQRTVAGEAFAELDRDKRLSRAITLNADDLTRLHRQEHFADIEQWAEAPPRPVDAGLLRKFHQFRELPESTLSQLAARSYTYSAPANARLLRTGMADSWNLYLLEGIVALTADDGAVVMIEGQTDKAAFPVSFLKPRKYNVDALTSVRFLWIHDLLLQTVLQG
jgi:hypothetical protein